MTNKFDEIKQRCEDDYIKYLSSCEHRIDYSIADCKLLLKTIELMCEKMRMLHTVPGGLSTRCELGVDISAEKTTPDYWIEKAGEL